MDEPNFDISQELSKLFSASENVSPTAKLNRKTAPYENTEVVVQEHIKGLLDLEELTDGQITVLSLLLNYAEKIATR